MANPKVDFFFNKPTQWQAEYRALRKLALDGGLAEELKWGCPCYTHDGANVVLIHGFKDYCALLFMKGALMKDPDGWLIQQTKNVQSARQIRFTGLADITQKETTLKAYLREAVAVETKGLKVTPRRASDETLPEELQKQLDENADLKKAFAALTPGRQRAYILYFAQAKQAKTRQARVEKCIPQILEGKGLDD